MLFIFPSFDFIHYVWFSPFFHIFSISDSSSSKLISSHRFCLFYIEFFLISSFSCSFLRFDLLHLLYQPVLFFTLTWTLIFIFLWFLDIWMNASSSSVRVCSFTYFFIEVFRVLRYSLLVTEKKLGWNEAFGYPHISPFFSFQLQFTLFQWIKHYVYETSIESIVWRSKVIYEDRTQRNFKSFCK